MDINYVRKVQEQEVKYLMSEKLKCGNGKASLNGEVNRKYPEVFRSQNDCKISYEGVAKIIYEDFNYYR